ncbi:MAG: lysophospholipid acyltransferase family protein [Myxococcaceae bacterium]
MSLRAFFEDASANVATLAAAATTVVSAPLAVHRSRQSPEAADAVVRAWAKRILAAARVRVAVEGLALLPKRSVVFVANHESLFDPLPVVAYVPHHIRFVVKKDLLKVPIFGPALVATGNVPVDRSGGEQDKEALLGAVDAVRERVSLLFYPEGTRSADGRVQPFKKGAAVLALTAQVPIVPLGCAGGRDIVPKGRLWIRSGRRLALVVGSPISTVGRGLDERDAVIAEAKAGVEAALRRAREILKGAE